jgi:hypothetical protein
MTSATLGLGTGGADQVTADLERKSRGIDNTHIGGAIDRVVDLHNTTDVPRRHRGRANRKEIGTFYRGKSGKYPDINHASLNCQQQLTVRKEMPGDESSCSERVEGIALACLIE